MSNRDWVYARLPVDEQDRGANDEGYYYDYCSFCDRRTEHELTGNVCCKCNNSSH
jgi:hypothetical protein